MNAMTAAAPRAGAREWIGLGVISLACLLYVMDLTVLHLAVPKLTADLKPSSVQLLWIIDIYGFLVAGSLITMGTLGDRIGRRKLLLIGAVFFGLASVLAAFSTSAEMLIASRAILGVAGATIAPSTLSLIRNMFLNPQQRTQAIGIWITSFSLGAAIGPLLGGVVLEFFWWGSVFLLAVPVMALLLVLGPRVLPEFRDPDAGRPDVLSAILSLVAVLSIIYGLKQIAQDGLGAVPVLSILLGVAVAIAFVRRQLTMDDPLLDLRLFMAPSFSASLAVYGVGALIVFGGFLFLPQYLQLVKGLSPLEAGLWMLPWALVVGSNVVPRLARRIPYMPLMAGGLAVAAIGIAAFTQIDAELDFLMFAVASVVFSLGLSPVFTLATDLVMGSAPPERAGAASAMAETAAEFSGALGIAIFGTIGTALYRGAMSAAVPAEIPPEAAHAARDTLGGAVALAAQLPGQVGFELVALAQGAFLQGLHFASWVSTIGSLLLAVFVAIALRNARAASEDDDQPDGLVREVVEAV
jgi:DHA2 family multidrug resistance protein-like MFS transporter